MAQDHWYTMPWALKNGAERIPEARSKEILKSLVNSLRKLLRD